MGLPSSSAQSELEDSDEEQDQDLDEELAMDLDIDLEDVTEEGEVSDQFIILDLLDTQLSYSC